MPGGGITGDGSVKWFIEMAEAQEGATRVEPIRDPVYQGKGLQVEGLEKAHKPEFEITIKHGTNRADFIRQLAQQLDLANNQGVEETTFTIPIESKPQGTDYRFPGDYQIRILW